MLTSGYQDREIGIPRRREFRRKKELSFNALRWPLPPNHHSASVQAGSAALVTTIHAHSGGGGDVNTWPPETFTPIPSPCHSLCLPFLCLENSPWSSPELAPLPSCDHNSCVILVGRPVLIHPWPLSHLLVCFHHDSHCTL